MGLGSENEDLPTFVVSAGSSRLRFQRPKELGIRVSAHSYPRNHHLSATREPHRGSPSPCRLRHRGQSPGRYRFGQPIEPTPQKQSTRETRALIPAYAATNWLPDFNLSATRALDISKEPQHILKMYGLDNPKTKYPKKHQSRGRNRVLRPQVPHRPQADRTGGAFRPDLER